MTNEERIYELCGCVMDLIDVIKFYDRDFRLERDLVRVKETAISIREDIDNS